MTEHNTRSGFVRASDLYDATTRTPITHPATDATDADVSDAVSRLLEDGGQVSPADIAEEIER